jgi:molecular chaperone DnaK (HSP70)
LSDKEKLGGKLSQDENCKISSVIEEKIKWLETNANAEVDDFKQQKKELEEIVNPIITKFYQNKDGQTGPTDAPGDKEDL